MMNTLKIKVNYLTYFVIILFLFSGFKNNLLYIFLVFTIHELGHIFFCLLFKIEIISIEIFPFGGVIKANSLINSSLYKKILVSSGGILFQLLLFLFVKNSIITSYNLYFLFINIIPVIPLDGSSLFCNFLNYFLPYYFSLIFTYIVSIISLVFIGVMLKNFTLTTFSLIFLIKNMKDFSYYFNKFLLERYLYNFKYKKSKYYNKIDLKKLQIGKMGFFYENTWKNEKYFLAKKFDKNP